MSTDDSVKVALRVRPLVQSEITRGCQVITNKTPNTPQIAINSGKNGDMFTFNYVFSAEETQEVVYHNAVKPLVNKLFHGYNVTILAYGQTGSGKTHTMGTAFDGTTSEDIGVIPRAVDDIFEKIDLMQDHTFNVTCAFMELYQEQLYDLLSTNSRDGSIVDIREDSNKSIYIPNLTESIVTSAKDTTNCLIKGSAGRAVGATAMNATSSRSHAIFTITIQMMKKNETNTSTRSKFHLVDLAGSERSKKTKATGDRFKEGVKINQGLLALGNVISALGSNQTNNYISYRDSKLTRLLQDSLGGNSVTLMIACVSPADYNMEETLSTLRYADRAKQIKNKPIVNQDPKTAEINRLTAIIQKLRLDLLEKGGENKPIHTTIVDDNSNELKKQQFIIDNLAKRLEITLHEVANMEHKLSEAETNNDTLINKIDSIKSKILDLNSSFNTDTCPAEFLLQANAIADIKTLIIALDDLIKHSNEDVQISNNATNPSTLLLDDSIHNEEEIKKKVDAFTNKQVEYHDQLRDVKQQLALKEELRSKLNGNFSNFCSFEDEFRADGKVKDYETIIENLEKEKDLLIKETNKNKSTVISAKLAEDRRKRVQQLEQEIAEMKKKNKHQAQLLKQREKDTEKIMLLQKDIQDMKQKKVKLIRTMKSESEEFRQWKLLREKEMVQLKAKDRKRENEMIKKEQLHVKQRNVLKRKVEEAVAINKRLKDALDKHKTSQANRKKTTVVGKLDDISVWLDQEIEIIHSVIDAKYSLDQLIEDRGDINQRLLNLKKQKTVDKNAISSLEEDIEMRNAQIADLQEKIKSCDIETKTKTICEGLNSMPEAKAAIKYLFNNISEMRGDFISNFSKVQDIRNAHDAVEESAKLKEAEWRDGFEKLIKEKNKTEKDYEEKITVLLRELNKAGKLSEESESQHIQQEAFERLQEKIEIYEEEMANMKDKLNGMTNKRRHVVPMINLLEDNFTEPEDDYSDDDSKDPDWRKTPAAKQARHNQLSKNLSQNSLTSNTTIDKKILKTRNSKDESDVHKCSCKSDCHTKICGCRKLDLHCNDSCKCSDICVNKSTISSLKRSNSFEENSIQETDESINNDCTPKKIKLNDQLTTPYPYINKKRRPFLDD